MEKKVTKNIFRDTIMHILNYYTYKISNSVRRDFITRTLIILIEKYDLNKKPILINYTTFKSELQKTIALMTGKININVVDEIINSIEDLDNENNLSLENKIENVNNDNIIENDSINNN